MSNSTGVIDYTDALLPTYMEHQKMTEIVSFDEDFDRFPRLKRRTVFPRPE
jgi:predicted nucleic acid-binding protein